MAICCLLQILSDPNASVVVLRKNKNKLRTTVYSECLRAINRLGLKKDLFKIRISPMKITYLKYGNSIFFTGSDSVDDTKGMIDEGKTFKMVVIDEVTEFFEKETGEDVLTNIIATFVRGNNDKFKMMYLFNPPKNDKSFVMQWTKKMEQRDDCIHIHTDYRDVPVEWLGQKLIDEAEMMKKSDEKMYRWLWLGECTGLDELIYYMFDEQKHVKQYERDVYQRLRYLGIGIDYGQLNATTFQAFGIDFQEKKIVGCGEYYHSGRTTGYQRSPSEYARDFKRFVEDIEKKTGNRVIFAVIDPSARGLAEEIKRVIPRIKIISADNTVIKGINRLQKLLSFEAITIDPSQRNAMEEFYLYEWNMDAVDRGSEVPIKANDHAMDAIRYIIMYLYKYMSRLLPYLKDGDD